MFLISKAGRLLSGAVVAVYLLGMTPIGIDLLPISYLLMAFAYSAAIFHYNIFDTKDIYDKKIFSKIKEGLIVVDDKGLLIDYNKAAQDVFEWLRQENKGKHLSRFDEGRQITKTVQPQFMMTLVCNGE